MEQVRSLADGLYILIISVHGLIRSNDLELGRDADTGGQIKYVVEFCRALSEHPEVQRVDLVTRLVEDPLVSSDYSKPSEQLAPGVNLVRLRCGDARYIRKELLWPHLNSFSDQIIGYLQKIGRRPDIVHSHYADGGYVASRIVGLLGVPMLHTGHSLGRVKRQRLLDQGLSVNEIEAQYNIKRRIEAEEVSLDNAAFVVASTRQEIDEQYSTYNSYQPRRMIVLPPGVDLEQFYPPKKGWFKPDIYTELTCFLTQPRKPMILALSRADKRKNISTLVQAYAENPQLRDMANLVIIAGNRDDIEIMEDGPRSVLVELLMLIDRYNLYGSIAYPKHHEPEDVPHLYRIAAKTGGVFVNPALTVGLTLLEAAASGLPIVTTEDGGPRDIVAYCHNGLLVNPLDSKRIANALLDILSDRNLWRRFSKGGIKGANRHFSWQGHVNKYVKEIKTAIKRTAKKRVSTVIGSVPPSYDRLVVCDIDNTLIGNKVGLKALVARLQDTEHNIGFGIATGRSIDSALAVLEENSVPLPDVLITAVGSEIYYGPDLKEDEEWRQFISYRWRSSDLRKAMREIPGIRLQPKTSQRRCKISYLVDPDTMTDVANIVRYLRIRDLHANVIYSHNAYLDLLPIRSSKGGALRYLAIKWGIPLDHMLVGGDSGNDKEMLQGSTCGVVVGNHSVELESLRGSEKVYFAERENAFGVMEGIDHYNFLGPVAAVEKKVGRLGRS